MARPNHEREPDDNKGSPPEAAAWGTWEELLLAYAVNRFGTNSWDSISSELRKRSTAQIVFTPKHCKQKYQELERRFGQSNGDDVDIDDGSGTTAAAGVPWIEELRKLRVAELQRELQNFDIYISSLQLKVKKLTEDGEKNGCAERNKKPELGQKIDEIEIKKEEGEDNKSADLVISGEEQVPGVDESYRDNQSMNGSNGNLETASPLRTVDGKSESSPHSPIRPEGTNKIRPDTNEPVKTEPSQEPESTVKDSSDVQSSASKSMKERNDRVRRGSSKGDEDQSRNSIPVKSLPLIDILQKVQKLGSAFLDRRLDRQEKLKYKNLIREHIDFEILQTRLKEGWYSDGNKNFFRDLLLLVNNIFIFFPNESQESISAIDLRKFIMNEMASKKKQKSESQPPKLIVCKKRSSIAAKETMSEKELSNEKERELELASISKKNSKNNKPVELEEKKKSAAKFLNRMKESLSVSKNEAAEVAAGGGSGNDGGGGGQKRGGEGKRSSGQRKEADSPTKKNVGRPPKKAGAQPPPGGGLGKRNRDDGESESLVSKQGKKKSKKL
ncbi:unnamed protein product [Lactuca saligna]|uniref:Bromo domain-containing protein n=1 Tax=Lactuca saligna TaxID=75948 RepID=A0AA36EME0_LACSI|nr:unnamed protein product [Lactuca saligna]